MAETGISRKEAAFREYLCKQGAAEEIVKVLVGLEEASKLPADPIAFMKQHFDAQVPDDQLSDLVKGQRPVDVEALVAKNKELKEEHALLSSRLAEVQQVVDAKDAARRASALGPLTEWFAVADADPPACDVSGLYASLAKRFPTEGAEGAPWMAEGVDAPAGHATFELLERWATVCFAYGTGKCAETLLETLVGYAEPSEEEVEPLEVAEATALFECCVDLAAVVTTAAAEAEAAAAAAAAAEAAAEE